MTMGIVSPGTKRFFRCRRAAFLAVFMIGLVVGMHGRAYGQEDKGPAPGSEAGADQVTSGLMNKAARHHKAAGRALRAKREHPGLTAEQANKAARHHKAAKKAYRAKQEHPGLTGEQARTAGQNPHPARKAHKATKRHGVTKNHMRTIKNHR